MSLRRPSDPAAGLGALLKEARVARGIARDDLARDLSLPQWMIEAIESDAWAKVPTGRARPLARRLAEHLGMDLDRYPAAWERLPGAQEPEPVDPRREALERVIMVALSIGSLGLLVWLVLPGPDLKGQRHKPLRTIHRPSPAALAVSGSPDQPFPVLGEVLPEAPVNEDGVLVVLRAMDTCECRITAPGQVLAHSLRASEPWKLRVKGPFTIELDNAGVVSLEVAGRRVRHGQSVGETWTARFGTDGSWLVPEKVPSTIPPTAPETDPSEPEE